MTTNKFLELQISNDIDREYAETLATKIRIAVKNGITSIHLCWIAGNTITSAEFLAFLYTVGKHLKSNNGYLRLKIPKGKLYSLMQIAYLHEYIVEGDSDSEYNTVLEVDAQSQSAGGK